jgi:MoaA/NifB/PqqE/SkfB family radical SAM enzyme
MLAVFRRDVDERPERSRSRNGSSRSLSGASAKLPAVCDFSVTSLCNAACDFCGFSRDKFPSGAARFADPAAVERALPILHRRGIRYMTLQGGEPLLHPEIIRLVESIVSTGIGCSLVTNGWFLSRHVAKLAGAGLSRLIVSIDSADLAEHERNRGLTGLSEKLAEGIAEARELGLPVQASVTVSRLVQYERLPELLRALGFDSVAFSYPRREALGSSSLVYSDTSRLVNLERDELLDALTAIDRLKSRFPVFNPKASLADVARFVRGEPQLVPCIGGYKYFYLDWNLDIWRCEAGDRPLGNVFDLDRIEDQRDPCNACMMACYRNASMLMHAGVAATDAMMSIAGGDLRAAAKSLFRRSVWLSFGALLEQMATIRRVTRRRPRRRRRATGGAAASNRTRPVLLWCRRPLTMPHPLQPRCQRREQTVLFEVAIENADAERQQDDDAEVSNHGPPPMPCR